MTTTQRVIKYCVITFATLLAVGIITFIAGLAIRISVGAVFISGITDSIGEDMEKVSFSRDFDAAGIKKLDIDNSYEELIIKKGDSFHIEAENVREDYHAEIKNGNTLYIGHKNNSFSFYFINISWPGENMAKVILTVPQDFVAEDIKLDTGSGGSEVDGLQSADFILNSGSGKLNLTNIETKKLVMDSGSGSVAMKNIMSEATVMDCGSGRVQINDGELGKFYLDSGSGSVVINNVSVTDYSLSASSGRVAFEDGSISGDILLDTGSGSVVITAKANPEDYQIDLSTGSGGVWINGEKKNDDYRDKPKNAIYKLNIDGGSGRVSIDLKE